MKNRDTFAKLRSAKVLLLDGADPVFASPKAWRVRESLEQIPFIASFGSFIDDTSSLADLILPDHSFLESWTENVPEAGASVAVVNVAGPVMRPLHQTRATPDVIIEVAGKLNKPIVLPWKSFDEMLKASMSGEAWTAAQKQGWTIQSAVGTGAHSTAILARFRFTSCRMRRRHSAMGRSRICPGCRRCPIRSRRRCGAVGSS